MATSAALRVAVLVLLLASRAYAEDAPLPPPPPPPIPLPEESSPPGTAAPEEDDLEKAARDLKPPPPIPGGPPRAPHAGEPGAVSQTGGARDFIHITVDRVGRTRTDPIDENTVALTLVGNPRIRGDGIDVKARTIVVYFDRGKVDLGSFASGGAEPATGTASALAPREGPGKAPAAADPSAGTSVVPEALLGVYAEGGVELVTDGTSFRALELYLDPRAHHALLLEPRFDTTMPIQGGDLRIPIHVRAGRFRVLAKGYAAFDDAEVSTSPANDRIHLRVRSLTVEEFGQAVAGEPLFLGFRGFGSLHYNAQGVEVRGERLPLGMWPDASFGGEEGLEDFPARIRRVRLAKRSSFGWYGGVAVGGKVGPSGARWLDWEADALYYQKRGPALGTAFTWVRPVERMRGALTTFAVNDRTGDDRDDYDAGEGMRGRVTFENRWEVNPRWRVDAEANWFSDRGVNPEFFESDDRNHKDRETYGRARWMDGGRAFTITGGAHVRDFETETIQLPEAQFWSESMPLFPRARLPLGLGLDLSTEARAGQVRRLFDKDLDDPSYEAWRILVQERLYAPFNVGDVRVSPFVGVRWAGYFDRSDGGEDLSRGALEAGVRADLQLSKDYDIRGGPFALDGLRHVIEIDGGVFVRKFGYDEDDGVPYFDRIDEQFDRTDVTVEIRNRIETRRVLGKTRRNAPLFDLRIRASWWPDDVGAYGREGPGDTEGWLLAEVLPQKAWVTGTALAEWEGPTLDRSSLGILWAPQDNLFVGGGIRQVRGELLAPWANVYWRWAEKWAVSASGLQDIGDGDASSYQARLLRFSPDHVFVVGFTVKDDGQDVGFFLDFIPAIGGRTMFSPFDPRETIDFAP